MPGRGISDPRSARVLFCRTFAPGRAPADRIALSASGGRLSRPHPSRLRLFLEYWLPVLVYAAVIITLSAQPRLRPPLDFQGADKWMHLLEYGGLGFVMVRAFRASMPRRDPLVAAFFALGLGILMAIGDEYFQSFIPGRDSSHLDALADTAGLIVAMLSYMAFTRD